MILDNPPDADPGPGGIHEAVRLLKVFPADKSMFIFMQ